MKERKIIIDTNLFLLLVIGAVESGRHIRNSKRLSDFYIEDYNIVLGVLSQYDKMCITHYIATEVSNLIDLNDYARKLAFEVAQNLFSQCEKIDSDIHDDSGSSQFILYGITDSSLIKLARDYIIFTNDSRLLSPLYEAGGNNIIPYEVAKTLASK